MGEAALGVSSPASVLDFLRWFTLYATNAKHRKIKVIARYQQVQGGSIQGIGMALHEELHYDPRTGIPLNAGYYGARVMTHRDAPDVEVLFVETEDAHGPYGAKPIGEPPIIPSVAAVANAFFNATGKRVRALPLTPEALRAAVRA